MSHPWSYLTLVAAGLFTAAPTSTQPAAPGPTAPRFTARFTPDDLAPLLETQIDLFPASLQSETQRQALRRALERVNMEALVERLEAFLRETDPTAFDPAHDLIVVPVPEDQRVTLPGDGPDAPDYRGPATEVVGFLLRGVTEAQYVEVAIHVMQTARQMVDSGDPAHDRTHADYYRRLAEAQVQQQAESRRQVETSAKQREEARLRIGRALGVHDPQTDTFEGTPAWLKESRRFSYIVDETTGQFIARLAPLVDDINRNLELAGFAPPSPLDQAGIQFDADLGDVEIVLPEPMMQAFLEEADRLERRMAEAHMISIEAVRLTDREIIDGAIASRLSAQVQGVHDVNRFNSAGIARQLGLNSLLAVANQRIQVSTLNAVQAGALPAGVAPVIIAPPQLPQVQTDRTTTTVGSAFSVGADDIFFDGREQSYGFSYIGPDGIEHTLSLDVVDSLREFWDRIERNLIVHKIKKIEKRTVFTVPVGPEKKTFEGIAALISQQDENLIVATGTGAISEISATAGTWLVIEDFKIAPIPGSSTDLTADEIEQIESRVLLTMFLRDARTPADEKRELLASATREEVRALLDRIYEERRARPIRPGRAVRTYATVYEQRRRDAVEDAAVEKKERNSVIELSFYSSQGNIIQQPGGTQLGSANDLTSFTTELRPNVVTPISSFFTKSGSGAKGTSPLTGVAKGEQTREEKTMTHLVIRARFPTAERERKDREEGRHLGYFELPISREPDSAVNLPLLSSSDHPAERLARFRVGMMFEALQADKIKEPLQLFNPNSLKGTVPRQVWETTTTRLMMCRKIISDSPNADHTLAEAFRQRFVVEVRSLLEYDEDFFQAPNVALRNMTQWNDPERIVLALNNTADDFVLERLVAIIDELGQQLIPETYEEDCLAKSPRVVFGGHKLYSLSVDELRTLRRDVANHYLRFQEAYGDAFLEAVSTILGLGSYRATRHDVLLAGPFRGYHDLVIFDHATAAQADPERHFDAQEHFALLKRGGYKGKLFEPSLQTIEDLPAEYRSFIVRGRGILE